MKEGSECCLCMWPNTHYVLHRMYSLWKGERERGGERESKRGLMGYWYIPRILDLPLKTKLHVLTSFWLLVFAELDTQYLAIINLFVPLISVCKEWDFNALNCRKYWDNNIHLKLVICSWNLCLYTGCVQSFDILNCCQIYIWGSNIEPLEHFSEIITEVYLTWTEQFFSSSWLRN